jgi:hypothetical protein
MVQAKQTPKAPRAYPTPATAGMRIGDKLAETYDVPVFKLKGMVIVPHCSKRDVWVMPGGQETSADELISLGAVSSTEKLWSRYWL